MGGFSLWCMVPSILRDEFSIINCTKIRAALEARVMVKEYGLEDHNWYKIDNLICSTLCSEVWRVWWMAVVKRYGLCSIMPGG